MSGIRRGRAARSARPLACKAACNYPTPSANLRTSSPSAFLPEAQWPA